MLVELYSWSVAIFFILIVPSAISPKDTSIDLCKENIDTKASAKDILRNVFTFKDALRLDFAELTEAKVIFLKEYTSMVIIIILL